MKRYLHIIAMAAGVAAALPVIAHADWRYDDDARYDYARVVKVDAIVNRATQPVNRQTCWNEPTTQYRPSYTYYRDSDDADDNGPDVITVQHETTSGYQQRCRTETDYRTTNRVLSYDVTYRYNGREYHAQMDHDPGERLRVRVNYDYSVSPDD